MLANLFFFWIPVALFLLLLPLGVVHLRRKGTNRPMTVFSYIFALALFLQSIQRYYSADTRPAMASILSRASSLMLIIVFLLLIWVYGDLFLRRGKTRTDR